MDRHGAARLAMTKIGCAPRDDGLNEFHSLATTTN
jgi:hypothetical protein